MKCITDIPKESLAGKRVLVRADFNVPVVAGEVKESARIDASFQTIQYLTEAGAKVIVMSHIGRDPSESLHPIFEYLKEVGENKKSNFQSIDFADSWDEEIVRKKATQIQNGSILLLQNVRAHVGEEENSTEFVDFLSSLADIYVNDAFSVSHRAHASVVGVPAKLESYMGCQFRTEFENLSKVFSPEHPFVVLMGGAKFETKIPVITKLLEKADTVFVGGALANDIYHANGFEVGKSLYAGMNSDVAKDIFNNPKILLPKDVRSKGRFFTRNKSIEKIGTEDRIIDGGTQSAQDLSQKIASAKFVVWNGPFGTFEKGNSFLSKAVIEAIEKSDAYSIVGGGDTVAEIKKLDKENVFSFVSLSGGAMLEFIAQGTLVGIEALS